MKHRFRLLLSPSRSAVLLGLVLASCRTPAPQWRAEKGGWFLDSARYRASVHGRIACPQCHLEIDQQSFRGQEAHGRKLNQRIYRPPLEGCGDCHPYQYDRFQQGPHGPALTQPAPGLPSCPDCHSAHYGRRLTDQRAAVELQLKTCGACHPGPAAGLQQGRHPCPGHSLAEGFHCGTCHDVHGADPLSRSISEQPVCQPCHASHQEGNGHEAQ